MDRKVFLGQICLFAALKPLSVCTHLFEGNYDLVPATEPINLRINLADPAYAKLQKKGGFVVVEEVVIAKANDGNFIAATVVCSHMQQKKITYSKDLNAWLCKGHGATYTLQGKGTNEHGKNGLRVYKVVQEGDFLQISNFN